MPTIILDGTGKTKAALVEMAFEKCGLSGAQFERTPEEITAGLREANALAAELLADGIDLGYDLPTYGGGLSEEPSGIPDSAVAAFTSLLAQRIVPGGFSLPPDAKAALNRSYMSLRSRFATVTVRAPLTGPIGAGYKRRYRVYPFTSGE